MLQVEILSATEAERAARILHRDGFVCLHDALTAAQLRAAQAGAQRVIREQTDADPERVGNRGHHRYSFGHQTHHPEWAMLIDLPPVLAVVDAIWGSTDYTCSGAGGDYSLPGAEIQPLHADMRDFFNDPLAQTTFRDVPAPFIVVNFTMVDFTRENGAIRFVPGTQRSHAPVPTLDEEPQWMRESILCAPAGTAIVRDVRCWHGGTANSSDEIRPMTSVGYHAPWFRLRPSNVLPRELHQRLSERGRTLSTHLVAS